MIREWVEQAAKAALDEVEGLLAAPSELQTVVRQSPVPVVVTPRTG